MLADWETITPPRDSAVLNVLRADPGHPLDFRIGRDVRGRFAFQLDGSDGLPEAGVVESPAGMDVVLDSLADGTGRLTLLLHDREDFAIFRVLCGDLLEVTRALSPADASRAMGMLLRRLGQWQEVLARRRRGRLSRNEAMGLFGELVFLRDVLAPRGGVGSAVAAWRGPYGDEQDFAIADGIIEVKTQGITSDSRLSISSEHQLDTSNVAIFLCRQCAAPRAADSGGESLDQVVTTLLTATLGLTAANTRLRMGLEAAGWAEDSGYDEAYSVEDRSWFRVTDDFPRIVGADLRPGVERVRYQITVADCLPFQVDEAEALRGEPS